MVFRLLRRAYLDAARWNQFIAHTTQPILYAQAWYLDVVSPGWAALVAEDAAGQWQAVLPLPLQARFGTQVVQQPLFCQLLGVFVRPGADAPALATALLRELPRRVRYASAYTGRLPAGTVMPAFFGAETRHTHTLDLRPPYAALHAAYSADRRLNLRRAQRFGWEIIASDDVRPLLQFFQENHAQRISGGVSPAAYALFEAVYAALCRQQAVRLLYARRDGQLEAGALFALHGGRVIYLFNAATPTGRAGNARTLLLDSVIREYAGQDVLFDFESPEVLSIAGFYRSFGAQQEAYVRWRYNRLPFPLRQLQGWRLRWLGL